MSSKTIYTLFNQEECNLHYLHRYVNFITSRHEQSSVYTEQHHILPASIFPEYENLKENRWNLIRLTGREHFIAHLMLSKIFINTNLQHRMLKAFWLMSSTSKDNQERLKNISSRLFAASREANSYSMKIMNPMHNPTHVDTARKGMQLFYESPEGLEYKKKRSEEQKGICNITDAGYETLRLRWLGVPRPQTKSHTQKLKESSSIGAFITPFGEFVSPQEAAESELNISQMTRFMIDRRCKKNLDGFSFQSNGNISNRGKYDRPKRIHM